MTRILVVDDDVAILAGLEALLSHEGYEVITAVEGGVALKALRRQPPDLVILDVMLPDMSGLQVCQQIRRERARLPVLMLTAKGEEDDKVLGLELGADDYIVKPFGTRELLARIKAGLRHGRREVTGRKRYTIGDRKLDCRTQELVTAEGRTVLTAREFDLLVYLAERRGRLVTREELLESVWGFGDGGVLDTRTVDSHVARLRRKIEPDPERPRYITTRRGIGYLLEAG